uniref:S-protein homolog n=1 Tax=Lotus japonicus TaxID=34305 RepID=I3S4H0_LOTJA|nr:unknown [Lotus japonicus]
MAMATPKMLSLLLFMTILFALRFDTGVTFSFLPPKITVEIINDLAQLPTNNTSLIFHCKSKDDDLGIQTLELGGTYSFHFRRSPSILKNTLFFCSFTWPEQHPSRHYFDIYDQHRDGCKFCSWKIWKQGACMYEEETGRHDMCLPWNQPSQ